jgi:hypothetical protein
MTRIIVDDPLRSQLELSSDRIELCDQDGKVFGYFLPATSPLTDSADSFEIPYSEEEMERRRQEEGGRSLSEIWKSLGRQ